MSTIREFVLRHHALFEIKTALPNDCYALRIGNHDHTVVRTNTCLTKPTPKSVLRAVSSSYYPHLARLVLANAQ